MMLEMRDICVSAGKKAIVQGVDLHVPVGTVTALIGKNGCGKSTLLSCLNGTRAFSGQILLSGEELNALPPRERAKRLALLPQVLPSPHITVQQLVRFGREPYTNIGKHFSAADMQAVENALTVTDTAPLCNRYIDTLSGGERQRAYLAMMLAQDTPLLVLDEPTTYMDIAAAHSFLELLTALRHQKTLLIVMHDLNSAVMHADRIAVMDTGRILLEADTEAAVASGIIEPVFHVQAHIVDSKVFFTPQKSI